MYNYIKEHLMNTNNFSLEESESITLSKRFLFLNILEILNYLLTIPSRPLLLHFNCKEGESDINNFLNIFLQILEIYRL